MFNIEIKTPSSGWYLIHRNISGETVTDFMADIARNYDENLIHSEVMAELNDQMERSGICTIGVWALSEDGNEGDFIQYRASIAENS